MASYSFKLRFVAPIQAGLGTGFGDPPVPCEPIVVAGQARYSFIARPDAPPKRQTIRAGSVGDLGQHISQKGRRGARPGGDLQLYCGMRTKRCLLVGRAVCVSVRPITIWIGADQRGPGIVVRIERPGTLGAQELDRFARSDGFADARDMARFWWDEHGGPQEWRGALIEWEPRA